MTRATRNGEPAWITAKPRPLVPSVPVVRKGVWAHLIEALARKEQGK